MPVPVPTNIVFTTGVEAPIPNLASRASIASLALACCPEWLTVATESVPEGFVKESNEVGKFVEPKLSGISSQTKGSTFLKKPRRETSIVTPIRNG